jgi:hypothetical protein
MIDGDLRELFKKRFQMMDDINDEASGVLAGEKAQRFWKVDSFSDRLQKFAIYFSDDDATIELDRNELLRLICKSFLIL